MMIAESGLEPMRDRLSQTIVQCLNSWPESHREIFVEIHYGGRSALEVARKLHLELAEVMQVLAQSERKLHEALKAFRSEASLEMPEAPPQPRVYPASCCSQ